jgi:hypothetical protein
LKYRNEAGEIELDCSLNYSKQALDVYKELNPEIFNDVIPCLDIFKESVFTIKLLHKQRPFLKEIKSNQPTISKNNKVLLAFSGGLD